MKVTKELAKKIANRLVRDRDTEELWEALDVITEGKLDATQLDLLTDMVKKEMETI